MQRMVYAIYDDGSHGHLRHGIWTQCRQNHKKVDYKTIFAGASAIGLFTLLVHMALKANGL